MQIKRITESSHTGNSAVLLSCIKSTPSYEIAYHSYFEWPVITSSNEVFFLYKSKNSIMNIVTSYGSYII